MACKTCGGDQFAIITKCRCCELVDKDVSKKDCKYCKICGVYLCKPCTENPLKRIIAFGRQFFE